MRHASSQRWAAGTASSPAYGFRSHSSSEPALTASATATPAPGWSGVVSDGSGRAASQRARSNASTIVTATPPSTARAGPSSGSTSGGTGAGGGAGVAPASASTSAIASPARKGAVQPPTQRSQGRTSMRRRRARANASTEATSAGRSRLPASSASTQPGINWLKAST